MTRSECPVDADFQVRIVFPHVAFSRFSLIPSPLPFLF